MRNLLGVPAPNRELMLVDKPSMMLSRIIVHKVIHTTGLLRSSPRHKVKLAVARQEGRDWQINFVESGESSSVGTYRMYTLSRTIADMQCFIEPMMI